MAAFHDFICNTCNWVEIDMPLTVDGTRCLECKQGKMEILWAGLPAKNANVHHSERAVVYISEKEGNKVQFPGRADIPVPARLQARGYRKVELNSIHDIKRIERETHSASHVLNYDRNGHSYDGSDS